MPALVITLSEFGDVLAEYCPWGPLCLQLCRSLQTIFPQLLHAASHLNGKYPPDISASHDSSSLLVQIIQGSGHIFVLHVVLILYQIYERVAQIFVCPVLFLFYTIRSLNCKTKIIYLVIFSPELHFPHSLNFFPFVYFVSLSDPIYFFQVKIQSALSIIQNLKTILKLK